MSPGRAASARPSTCRPHLAQRIRHTAHRAFRQRGVTTELRLERTTRQQTQQQADRGSRVPAIDWRGGSVQPVEPDTRHSRVGPVDPAHLDPQRAQRRRRRQVVPSPPQPAYLHHAVGQRPEQQRPMRDRLVAENAARPFQRPETFARESFPSRLMTTTPYFLAPATICSNAFSFSASPSRLSAGMCRWPCTRVPSTASFTSVNNGARPSSINIRC